MKKISLILVVLLVLSLGLVGCGTDNQDPVEEDPVEEESADEEPSDEEPADEEPADEEPTEEEPVDEEPAEEEPAEEEQADEGSDENVFANVNPKSPIIVTSYGQSSDGAMVKALLGKAGATHDYKQIIESSELSGYNTIVIAPGASSKGLGSAGISPEEEVERVQEITDNISSSTKVIVVHIGGENRRGDLSDQMIDIALEKADAIIVVESGDADGIFSNFASTNNIPIEVVPTMNDTVDSFENLFD